MVEFVFRDALFIKIKDSNNYNVPGMLSFDVLNEFFENYILKRPDKTTLFSKMSDMWVLALCNYSDGYVRSNEKKLKDILNDEQLQIIRKNKKLIVGLMLMKDVVSKCNDNSRQFEYIDFIDTRLRGHNLAEVMMDKYKLDQKRNVFVLPYEMVPSSRGYWYDTNEDVMECFRYNELLSDLVKKDGVRWLLDDPETVEPSQELDTRHIL